MNKEAPSCKCDFDTWEDHCVDRLQNEVEALESKLAKVAVDLRLILKQQHIAFPEEEIKRVHGIAQAALKELGNG